MNQKIGLNDESCDILPMSGFVAALQAADALDSDISSELGQLVSLFDEAEKGLEVKLYRIRELRRSIKEKQRKKRKLTAECGIEAAQLFS